ncbi:hypothetical protein [Glaciecola petra]|uniref:Ankyrin repeat domain-containing protein n=1 Tax=Glaciecola petra TaxID=3075602 RepID=A0ABU2ZRR0_9ALTE|nr:hypothetical protein [Aestuariibacter sp. P117]MDT0595086.1 hypothetical protein [Aestuariibacter sp. P117]
MSLLRKLLLLLALVLLSYVVFSVYFYSADRAFTNTTTSNIEITESPNYEVLTPSTQATELNNEALTSQCSGFQTALESIYPNSESLRQAHLNLVEQWILKNSDLSTQVRDKIAASIGLQYAYRDIEFVRHLRLPINIDLAAQQPETIINTKTAMDILFTNRGKSLDNIREKLKPIVASAIGNRLQIQMRNESRTFFGAMLERDRKRDNAKYLNALLDAGYKIKLLELTEFIVSSFSKDENIKQLTLNAYTDDLNYRFSAPDSAHTMTLVLFSLHHEEAELADYFLSQGVDFNTDINLRHDLTQKIPYFPISASANLALENLLNAGVFLFTSAADNKYLEVDVVNTESTNKRYEQERGRPPLGGETSLLDNLVERFGESKAKAMMARQTQTDLLSEDERNKANTILNTFLRSAINLLPQSLQVQRQACDLDYAKALFSLQQTLYKKDLNRLYKALETWNDDVNFLVIDRYSALEPEIVSSLMSKGSYAAKQALEEHVQRKSITRVRNQAEQFDSRTVFSELDRIVESQGIDEVFVYLRNAEDIPEEYRQSLLWNLQISLDQKITDFESFLSSNPATNFARMVDLIGANRASELVLFAENNVNLNYTEEAGRNLLWHAVKSNAKTSFDFLIANNVQLQPPEVIGFDALDVALDNVRTQNTDFYFVDKLLSSGFNIKSSHVELLRDLAKNHYDKIANIFEQYDIPLDQDATNE